MNSRILNFFHSAFLHFLHVKLKNIIIFKLINIYYCMVDDVIDIVNEKNKILEQQLKSKAHKEGLLHRVAHVWMHNSKGGVLLQLRAKNKLLFPNMWDVSAAGHILAGEEVIISALREVEEEIGLKLEKKDLEFIDILRTHVKANDFENNEFAYLYLYKFEGNISKLVLQEEEVQEIKFFPIEEIEEKLKSNPEIFTPYPSVFKRILEEVRKRIN